MSTKVLSDLDFGGVVRGVNHPDPVNAQDVATKAYVERNDGVTNVQLADMAAGTVKGRRVDDPTGDPVDLTGAEQGENLRLGMREDFSRAPGPYPDFSVDARTKVLRITPTSDGDVVFTGFALGTNNTDGVFLLVKLGTGRVVLRNEDATSLSGNRIVTPLGQDYVLDQVLSSVWLFHQAGRWSVAAQQPYTASFINLTPAGAVGSVDISTLQHGGIVMLQPTADFNISGFTSTPPKPGGFTFDLLYRDATTYVGTLNDEVGATPAGDRINNPGSVNLTFTRRDAVQLRFASNRWKVVSTSQGTWLTLTERASGTTLSAGQAQFFAKNDTPNNPYFRDDTNSDRKIVTAPVPLADLTTIAAGSVLGNPFTASGEAVPKAISGSEVGEIVRFYTGVDEGRAAGTYEDVSLSAGPNWRITGSGSGDTIIGGILYAGSNVPGRFIRLFWRSLPGRLILKNESALSVATNRITTGLSGDLVLPGPAGSIDLQYVGTRWIPRVVGEPGVVRLTETNVTLAPNTYDDYPLSTSVLRVYPNAAGDVVFTGFALSGGNTGGFIRILKANTSTTTRVILRYEGTSSLTAANRIRMPGGDYILDEYEDMVDLQYVETDSRWHIVTRSSPTIFERALGTTLSAGQAQFFAKNDTPNNPYFRDDVNNDRKIITAPVLRADMETVGVGTQLGLRIDDPASAVPVPLTGAEQGENYRANTRQTVSNLSGVVDVTLNNDTTILVLQLTGDTTLRTMVNTAPGDGRLIRIEHDGAAAYTLTIAHNTAGLGAPFYNPNEASFDVRRGATINVRSRTSFWRPEYPGWLNRVRINSGGSTLNRGRINAIAGNAVGLALADSPAGDEVNLAMSMVGSTSNINLTGVTGSLGVIAISTLECGGSVTLQPTGDFSIDGFSVPAMQGFWFDLVYRDTTAWVGALNYNVGNASTAINTPGTFTYYFSSLQVVRMRYQFNRWRVHASPEGASNFQTITVTPGGGSAEGGVYLESDLGIRPMTTNIVFSIDADGDVVIASLPNWPGRRLVISKVQNGPWRRLVFPHFSSLEPVASKRITIPRETSSLVIADRLETREFINIVVTGTTRYWTLTQGMGACENYLDNVLGDIPVHDGKEFLKTQAGSLPMLERSSGMTLAAGYGHFFAKNDTPNNPYFRDDTNADRKIITAPVVASDFSSTAAGGVLMNAGNASAVPAFVAPTAGLQYLRRNSANTANEWGALPAISGPTGATGYAGGAITAPYVLGAVSVATETDPGSGNYSIDGGIHPGATVIRISDVAEDGSNWRSALWSLGSVTNTLLGQLRIVQGNFPSNYALFNVTGVTQLTGYTRLTVSFVGGGGSGGVVGTSKWLTVTLAGNVGATGSTGPTGATGPTLGWDASLAINPSSGANSPLIPDGQYLGFGTTPPADATARIRSDGALKIVTNSSLVADALAAISLSASGAVAIYSIGDYYILLRSLNGYIALQSPTIHLSGSITAISGILRLVERASAGVSLTAGQFALWVKDDTPNNLYLRDDTNVDRKVVTAPVLGTDLSDRIITANKLAAPVNNKAVPFTFHVAYAAGSTGARDIEITTGETFNFRIYEVQVLVNVAVAGSSGALRSAAGGGGSALSFSISTATLGTVKETNRRVTDNVAAGTPIYWRLTDGGVEGHIIVHCLPM